MMTRKTLRPIRPPRERHAPGMPAISACRSCPVSHRPGVALLMVLLILTAVTILATGFLASTDSELACGKNMLARVQLDQVAQSGLDHARGLILHPQLVPSEFWQSGATHQKVIDQENVPDCYDVWATVDPNDCCT